MLFWFLLALMTGAAVFSVLWPLGRRRSNVISENAADVAVYRDQLAEIKNEQARGLIAEPEAEAARTEIARRLMAAANRPEQGEDKSSRWRRRTAALLLYLSVGSPGLPGVTPSDRVISSTHPDIAMLLARVENHLAEHPDDGRGWELLAPLYLRMGRAADAVNARGNALRLLGETADRQADFGEALVADANGVVTANARAAFERAIALDGKQPKARFFLGLAAEQDGRKADAEKIWQELAANAPPDASYLPAVRAALERLKEAK